MLADKAYAADRIRAAIREKGAVPNIPPKANRRSKPYFSTWLYRERNLIERFFSKLKHFRRVATRYDKLAENFLAMVQLASMRLWLRVYESTVKPHCRWRGRTLAMNPTVLAGELLCQRLACHDSAAPGRSPAMSPDFFPEALKPPG